MNVSPLLFWPVVALAVVGGVALVMVVTGKNPLPIDRGSYIFSPMSDPDPKVRAKRKWQATRLLSLSGHDARFEDDDTGVSRAIGWNPWIINDVDPALWEEIGRPATGLGIGCDDPEAEARTRAADLRDWGYEARVVVKTWKNKKFCFLVNNLFQSTVLVYRPKIIKLDKPPAYDAVKERQKFEPATSDR